jgi:DNA processing protein
MAGPLSEATDFAALSLSPLWWRREIAARLRAGQRAAEILELLVEQPQRFPLNSRDIRERASATLARAAHVGAEAIPWCDSRYPTMLAAIDDAPPMLWVLGEVAAVGAEAVAIVGSRAGSAYALTVAERLAADLVARGITIVSGLARGVDSAAHRGALAGGGRTVAVFGSGPDVVYPREHRQLAQEVAAAGALLSELAPGTRPHPRFFPMRNRIISGLSRAVVVIEAGEKSGSLITARTALEQGRDVLAVPGNVLNGRNRGSHALLRDGAKIVESADDILEELGYGRDGSPNRQRHASASNPGGAAPTDAVLASLPDGDPCDLDEIVARSGLTVPRLLPRLLDLELRGLVRRVGGGRFVRI